MTYKPKLKHVLHVVSLVALRLMESFSFPTFPSNYSAVYATLYTDIKNAIPLRRRIIEAAAMDGEEGDREREAVNFAFINARLITSLLHLQTAVYQAILAAQSTLRTKTVHSEVLWALNPTNNITEAIRRYGVSDTTSALFVVRIDGPNMSPSEIQDKMNAVVSGTVVPVSVLETLTNWTTIKKYHKLEVERKEMVDNIVVSTVAMKSVQ